MAIHVGTSGYAYRHWRGVLYPPGLPQRQWLERYAAVFSTVELNATFYRLPTQQAVERWRSETPRGFTFSCKGSRFITHLKRLRSVDDAVERYLSRVARLGRKLEVVLWQLPPQASRPDLERLEGFLSLLPEGPRHAIEFRSEAWYLPEVCELLDRHRVAFCEHDLVGRPPPSFTGGFRYLRFHGASAPYRGRYGPRGLARFARSLAEWASSGREAWAYFNNDLEGHAVRDALALEELLGLRPQATPAGGLALEGQSG